MAISLGIGLPGLAGMQSHAKTFARSMFDRHDLSTDETPEDLRDTTPRFSKTREGRRVSANLLPQDVAEGGMSTTAVILLGTTSSAISAAVLLWFVSAPLAVMVLAASILVLKGMKLWDFSPLQNANGYERQDLDGKPLVEFGLRGVAIIRFLLLMGLVFSGLYTPLVWALWGLLRLSQPIHFALQTENTISRTLAGQAMIAAGDSSPLAERMGEAHIHAREVQRKAALADPSPIFQIGTATGALTEIGDGYAPDRGAPFGMTAEDMSTSLLVLGETGSGKTSGILRGVFKFWAKNQIGGALVLDGKGDLPNEFAGAEGYTLIAPGHTAYGLIEGLKAEDVSSTLSATMKGADKGGDFWSRSGETLLRNAAVVLEAANESNPLDFPWTLLRLRQIVTDDEVRKLVIAELENSGKCSEVSADTTVLSTAYRYFKYELPALADETRSSYISTVDSWLAPILGHRELFDWASTATGFDPTKVCEGALVGVATPEYLYGNAGVAVQQLIKARVYRAIKARGSKWKTIEGQTPVMLLIDECQELIGPAEGAMSAISRSLGLRFVCATQHLDGLFAKFTEAGTGEHGARALLGNFRSLVSFISSPITLAFVSERMGEILRREKVAGQGSIAFDQIAKVRVEGMPDSGTRDAIASGIIATLGRSGRAQNLDAQMGQIAQEMNPLGLQQLPKYQLSVGRVLTPAEAGVFLRAPFTAVAQVMRGGVIRRDVIQVEPEFA